MKQLIDLIRQYFHEEGFTTKDYIYCVLSTIGFIALCILAETLEHCY